MLLLADFGSVVLIAEDILSFARHNVDIDITDIMININLLSNDDIFKLSFIFYPKIIIELDITFFLKYIKAQKIFV
ncbi:MAG: hypothetical protein A2X70_07025 [Alphaproteobacteria bacterium GWC2_42_16]|nr:MAG: hypothetical protein A2X70_07025 [Alphaproteobacteria bacterium GWC2_42_16]OFW72964.1 MAG: hypothetical protein A2Z80_02785 [Alphaproteobacteria bacterium GWA2_41_27]OFW81524.1 MAG: hypothetical protein A3E50_05150 [Alphaproteobacteria bacterium RIFCSPHIGHO2_12_FULL_42_100]OFW86776.1 MAG: hypothetical protein A2W06_06070 [Alphaproteobacteria bacterium RBG_16_42_14]OFW90450.1 MAG: hypothetical protein A3C41_05945 [Alphaproteobacteria bacterium RIFCSPHIGHO2_02_FULL_42_30]OFW92350.1 MAG: 